MADNDTQEDLATPSDDVTVEGIDLVAEDAEPSLEEQLAAANDRALRLQAEVQNQITRAARLASEERQFAALPVVRDLLPVLDNMDRAIEAAEKDEQSGGLLDGIKMVREQLVTVLKQHNCEPIETEGQAFNPDFHEAILQQPSADIEAGHIVMQTQVGYKMHDRVVRASQVIVSSGPAE